MNGELTSANGALFAGFNLSDIIAFGNAKVPAFGNVFQMVFGFVGSRNHVYGTLNRIIVNDHDILAAKSHRTDIACNQLVRIQVRRHDIRFYNLFQFGFVDFQIASDKRDYRSFGVAANVVTNRLYRLFGGDVAKIFCYFADLLCRAGKDFFHRQRLFLFGVVQDRSGDFHICGKSALRANDYGVFAYRSQQHELVRDTAAHHARIGFDGDKVFHAYAFENSFVSMIRPFIICFQILFRHMERVSVLHRKFPDSDQAAARTTFVAEFGLDLVNHKRQLLIGVYGVTSKLNGCLFVSHSQHHIAPEPVLEPHHFVADGSISTGFFPQLPGHNDGESTFLTFQRVHFLADYVFYFFCDTLCWHGQRPNTVGYQLYVAGAYHQRVALNYRVGRSRLCTLADQFRNQHTFTLPQQ